MGSEEVWVGGRQSDKYHESRECGYVQKMESVRAVPLAAIEGHRRPCSYCCDS